MSDKFIKMLSTWFYVGNLPGAPGTIASAVGVLMAVLFSPNLFLYVIVLSIVTIVGFKVSGRMETLLDRKDPGCIVIDEVSGVMIAFIFLPVTSPAVVIAAFFLFRAFDMFKIYPANKFEQLGGSKGVMLDDIIAGVYTNIVMQIAIRWAGVI